MRLETCSHLCTPSVYECTGMHNYTQVLGVIHRYAQVLMVMHIYTYLFTGTCNVCTSIYSSHTHIRLRGFLWWLDACYVRALVYIENARWSNLSLGRLASIHLDFWYIRRRLLVPHAIIQAAFPNQFVVSPFFGNGTVLENDDQVYKRC